MGSSSTSKIVLPDVFTGFFSSRPVQGGFQNQAYAPALKPLSPFAFQSFRQRRFVHGREIEWIHFHKVVFQIAFFVTDKLQLACCLRQWVKT